MFLTKDRAFFKKMLILDLVFGLFSRAIVIALFFYF